MKTFIVDSFTNEAFKGNPAGVCLLEQAISDPLMQSIAQELGLSETAFIKPLQRNDTFSIRFFSPKMEIPLCGHATLAASKVVLEQFACQSIHFLNIQGLDLFIITEGNEIIMEFPVYQTTSMEAPEALLQALGIAEINNSVYNAETNILLLEIESAKQLRELSPDFSALYESIDTINGVLLTAPADDEEYDFHSRYFWPWSGTNEDPVTGGTHTFLTPYWTQRLGKTRMKSFQSSQRTGFMEVELLNDHKMTIRSQAQIVLEGKLRL